MTTNEKSWLFGMLGIIVPAVIVIFFVVVHIDNHLSTDNQTMARLRDENAILRRDLTDTEKALDEQALKALHLEEENERMVAEREMEKGRGKRSL